MRALSTEESVLNDFPDDNCYFLWLGFFELPPPSSASEESLTDFIENFD